MQPTVLVVSVCAAASNKHFLGESVQGRLCAEQHSVFERVVSLGAFGERQLGAELRWAAHFSGHPQQRELTVKHSAKGYDWPYTEHPGNIQSMR